MEKVQIFWASTDQLTTHIPWDLFIFLFFRFLNGKFNNGDIHGVQRDTKYKLRKKEALKCLLGGKDV